MNNSQETKSHFHTPLWKAVGGVIFFGAIYGSVSVATMLVDREPPITYIEREILTREVPQGGAISVAFTVERTRSCKSDIERWVIDSTQTKHAITSFTTALSLKLGKVSDTRDATLPALVSLGPASYYVESYYYCNVLQRIFDWPIIIRSPNVKFNVVTPKPIDSSQHLNLSPNDIQNLKELQYMMPNMRRLRFALESYTTK